MKPGLVCFLLIISSAAYAQQSVLSVQKKQIGGWILLENDQKISINEAQMITSSNVNVTSTLHKAKNNRTAGMLIGLSGSVLIFTGIITFQGSSLGLVAAGIGLAVVSIPFSIKSRKQAMEATAQWNLEQLSGRVGITPHGIGVVLRF